MIVLGMPGLLFFPWFLTFLVFHLFLIKTGSPAPTVERSARVNERAIVRWVSPNQSAVHEFLERGIVTLSIVGGIGWATLSAAEQRLKLAEAKASAAK